MNILTVCSGGLVRSVGLADVLKLHFEPTDVIPIGIDKNSEATLEMLANWADVIVAMHEPYYNRLCQRYPYKHIVLCEVGPDVYGYSKHPELIDKVWRWARDHQTVLGISEHSKVV